MIPKAHTRYSVMFENMAQFIIPLYKDTLRVLFDNIRVTCV